MRTPQITCVARTVALNLLSYVASVDTDQLKGSTSTSSIDDCSPLEYNGSLVLHPCGLIANTLFNDIIKLTSGATMDESGIAWESDLDYKVRIFAFFLSQHPCTKNRSLRLRKAVSSTDKVGKRSFIFGNRGCPRSCESSQLVRVIDVSVRRTAFD